MRSLLVRIFLAFWLIIAVTIGAAAISGYYYSERLREALVGFKPQRDIAAPRVGKVLGISGFGPFDDSEFRTIRKAAEQEGMVPSPDAGPG